MHASLASVQVTVHDRGGVGRGYRMHTLSAGGGPTLYIRLANFKAGIYVLQYYYYIIYRQRGKGEGMWYAILYTHVSK